MSSRVSRMPVVLPQGVEVSSTDTRVTVKGKHGTIEQPLIDGIGIVINENQLSVVIKDTADEQELTAMAGTTRALLNNAVAGVAKKFEKKLVLVGVGYRVQLKGTALHLTLGFSHPVVHELPAGVAAECPSQTEIVLSAVDKQVLGQVAADIRSYRPPEPYKGKGIRYADEDVIIKETKKK